MGIKGKKEAVGSIGFAEQEPDLGTGRFVRNKHVNIKKSEVGNQ